MDMVRKQSHGLVADADGEVADLREASVCALLVRHRSDVLPGDGHGEEAEQQDEEDGPERCNLGLLLWTKTRDDSATGGCSTRCELVLLHEGRDEEAEQQDDA